jgi:hypothetical protein
MTFVGQLFDKFPDVTVLDASDRFGISNYYGTDLSSLFKL